MTPAPQKENCIHYEVCSSLVVGGFLGCISPEECKFYHTRASSDKVLDKAIDKITAQLNDRDKNWRGMQKSIKILAELRQQTKER